MADLSITMIPATNFEEMVRFYTNLGNLDVTQKTDDFVVLRNPRTQESICITNGHSVSKPAAAFRSDDIRDSLTQLQNMGGKIHKVIATCSDPEGNEILIIQNFDRKLAQ